MERSPILNKKYQYIIDTHCHIYAEQYNEDRDVVISNSLKEGVSKIMMACINTNSIALMKTLAEKYPNVCYPMIAIHPCEVKNDIDEKLSVIKNELENGKYVAIGETGIDLYWDKSTLELQQKSFKQHLEWGKEYDLPVIIHIRDSFPESFECIEKNHYKGIRGIFHCFSGTANDAKRAIDLGFLLGIGGIVTFKNNHLQQILPEIGLKNIVLETDSPYLAPTPHRGKRNEPTYTKLVAEKVAEILKVDFEEVAHQTTYNALNLFNLQNEAPKNNN